ALEFERAATLRDRINTLRTEHMVAA
ncbi:MAG: hypothetical protein GY943_29905, partial [Chloroflexi bacterium]|nr:hypothetical protein [Chloroflexota bacterium]